VYIVSEAKPVMATCLAGLSLPAAKMVASVLLTMCTFTVSDSVEVRRVRPHYLMHIDP
jgi:hypothetical protein